MVPVRSLAGRRVAILGLTGPGLAAARALRAGGAELICWDDDETRRAAAVRAGYRVEDLTTRDWSGLARLVIDDAGLLDADPRPRLLDLAEAVGAEITPALTLLAEAATAPHEAGLAVVTGRNAEAAAALAAHLLANAATPARSLCDPRPGRAIRIAALASGEAARLPESVTPEAVVLLSQADTRSELLDLAARSGVLISAADLRKGARLAAGRLRGTAALISGRMVVGGGVHAVSGRLIDALDGVARPAGALPAWAPFEAVAAGWALARRLGASFADCRTALNDWTGAPGHGCEIARLGRSPIVDWSAAVSPALAVDAVTEAPCVWIAGPALDKSAADLLDAARTPPRAIVLIGDKGRAEARLQAYAPVTIARTLDEALGRALHAAARHGSPVVYAPGSVSGQTGSALPDALGRLTARALSGDAA
ncbi:MAG: hypothetical protein ABL308_08230 [Oceanicaulis sp.]